MFGAAVTLSPTVAVTTLLSTKEMLLLLSGLVIIGFVGSKTIVTVTLIVLLTKL